METSEGGQEPGVFKSLRQTLHISARLYRGKQQAPSAIHPKPYTLTPTT